jgi:hypothetical protein
LQTSNSLNFAMTEMSTTRFISHFAYIGVHFESSDQVKFKSLSVRFHGLDEWFCKKAIDTLSPSNGSLVATYTQPQPINTIAGDFHIDFVTLGPNENFNPYTHINISQEAQINIWSETEKDIEEFFPILRLLQYFLTLAMTEPTFVTKAIGKTEAAKQGEPDHVIFLPVEIYYPAAGWQTSTSDVHWHEMLFTLPIVEERLEIILNNWVTKAETIRPVYDLYFSTIYSQIYPEFELLSLAQAIETYHRQVYGGKYQPDDAYMAGLYQILVTAIPEDVSSDFRDSLKKGRLRYANEYSFRKRIFLLENHVAKNMKVNFLSENKQRVNFADKVADTRNYFTHYSPELKGKAALRGEELRDLRRNLRLILQVCFLEGSGFSFEEITAYLKKSKKYRQFIL